MGGPNCAALGGIPSAEYCNRGCIILLPLPPNSRLLQPNGDHFLPLTTPHRKDSDTPGATGCWLSYQLSIARAIMDKLRILVKGVNDIMLK